MKKFVAMTIAALIMTAAMAQAQDTMWARTYSSGMFDQGKAVATSGTDIIVAGTNLGESQNILVIKYNAEGETAWTRVLDIQPMEKTVDVAIGTDNKPVVGVSVEAEPPTSLLVKLLESGDTAWTRQRDRTTLSNIAIGTGNAIYTWSSVMDPAPFDSFVLAKYNPDGTPAWEKVYQFGLFNRSAGCCCDGAGNIIAAAMVADQGGMHPTIIKFKPNGDTIWMRFYNELGGAEMTGIAVDQNKNIFAAAVDGPNLKIIKCDSTGEKLWDHTVETQPDPEAYNILATDGAGNLVIPVVNMEMHCGLLKLGPDGSELWNGSTEIMGLLFGAAVDSDDRPIATGMDQEQSSCLTIKFTGRAGISRQGWLQEKAKPFELTGTNILGPGATLELETMIPGDYEMTLFNRAGARIRTVFKGQLQPGNYSFNPGLLAAGEYFLNIRGPIGKSQDKLIRIY